MPNLIFRSLLLKKYRNLPLFSVIVCTRQSVYTSRKGERTMVLLQRCADIIAPYNCVLCDRLVSYTDNALCQRCRTMLADRYYTPIRNDLYCIYLDGAISFLAYDTAVQKLVVSYKEKTVKQLMPFFIAGMCMNYRKYDIAVDCVTAVPMTGKKKRQRGFNQAVHLAKGFSKQMNLHYTSLLERTHDSDDQKKLSRKERMDNVKGLFRCIARVEAYCSVLIIDDIMTTGATLNECAYILKKNGVNRVFSLTIGRVA